MLSCFQTDVDEYHKKPHTSKWGDKIFDNIVWVTHALSRVKDYEAKRRPKAIYKELI